jgi:hypothetical protein
MSPNARGWWGCGASANEYSCKHGAQINFGDLTSYLTYGSGQSETATSVNSYLVNTAERPSRELTQHAWLWAEAELLDVIRTKVVRVFLLLFTVTSTNRFTTHLPMSKSGLKLVCNVNIVSENFRSENSQDCAKKPQQNCTFMNLASGCVSHHPYSFCPAALSPYGASSVLLFIIFVVITVYCKHCKQMSSVIAVWCEKGCADRDDHNLPLHTQMDMN